MGGRKQREVPARLRQLKQRFVEWRQTRVPGERIPDRLWKSAARLAMKYGLNQTAEALALDYYSLKRRVDESAQTSSEATFIELSPVVADSNECVIELEDGAGASMRVHLKGPNLPDVLALARNFWDAD